MRLIDADKLMAMFRYPIDYSAAYVRKMIDAAPTIDAVEVVRCAKCAEFDDGTCRLLSLRLVDNDFCSYGYCDEGEREEKNNG